MRVKGQVTLCCEVLSLPVNYSRPLIEAIVPACFVPPHVIPAAVSLCENVPNVARADRRACTCTAYLYSLTL